MKILETTLPNYANPSWFVIEDNMAADYGTLESQGFILSHTKKCQVEGIDDDVDGDAHVYIVINEIGIYVEINNDDLGIAGKKMSSIGKARQFAERLLGKTLTPDIFKKLGFEMAEF